MDLSIFTIKKIELKEKKRFTSEKDHKPSSIFSKKFFWSAW